jgi:CheY-like chemotaxis protein
MARILLAEDDQAVREFVTRALEGRGHHIFAVADGLQAIDVLRYRQFDLVVSDIVMPGMDGIALALKLAKDYPDLPILLMSGMSAERQRAEGTAEPAREVLPKPFTLQEMCNAVDAALRKRH